MNKKKLALIKNTLRNLSLKSKERNNVLKKSRIRKKVSTYKNGKDKYVYFYQCNICKDYFRSYEIEVDHIEEVGSHTDLNVLAQRILCGEDNLQVLCHLCHATKTQNFMLKLRRKKKDEKAAAIQDYSTIDISEI